MSPARGANTPFHQYYLFLTTLQKLRFFKVFGVSFDQRVVSRLNPHSFNLGDYWGTIFPFAYFWSPSSSNHRQQTEREGSHAAHRHAMPYRKT